MGDTVSRDGQWGSQTTASRDAKLAVLRSRTGHDDGPSGDSSKDDWIEGLPAALVDTWKHGIVRRCNRAARDLLGPDLRAGADLRSVAAGARGDIEAALDVACEQPAMTVLSVGERQVVAHLSTLDQDGDAVVRWLLTDESDRFEEVSKGLPAVLYTCEADDVWTCRSVTQRVETLTGVTREAWVRHPHLWLELVAHEDRPRLLSERWRVQEQGGTLSCEYRIVTRGGRVQWVHDQATVDDDGVAHGLLVDVTHRHKLEGVLNRLHDTVQAEVQQLRLRHARSETFFRTAVHDLRTALTGMSALVRDGSDLDQLGEEVRRAHDLATAILGLDGLGEPAESRVVDVGQLLASVVERVAPRDHPVTMEADGVVGRVEPAVASRVVSNLVANAARHTPAGTPIRVRAAVTRRDLVFAVEDDGPGIDPGHAEQMFRPGQRRDGSPGLGFGLSLARELTELSGGRMWHEELPAGGTSFQVSFPQ